MLGKAGFSYVPQIPSLAHKFLDGTITAEGEATLTAMQSAQNFTGSMADFCTTYIDKLSEAYNYGFRQFINIGSAEIGDVYKRQS